MEATTRGFRLCAEQPSECYRESFHWALKDDGFYILL